MSEQVQQTGKLIPLERNHDQTWDDVAKDILIDNNLKYSKHTFEESPMEALLECDWIDYDDPEDIYKGHRYMYSRTWDILFKLEVKDASDKLAIITASQTKGGEISFDFYATYYNGSSSLGEVLEDELGNWSDRLKKHGNNV